MAKMPVFRVVAVAIVAAAMSASHAWAETQIRFSAGVAPKHVINANGIEPWIKAVEKASNGEIKVRNFTGGQLLSVQGALAGVKSGLADGSVYPFPFYPAEYPIEKLISDIILGYSDTVVLASAMKRVMEDRELRVDVQAMNALVRSGEIDALAEGLLPGLH